LSQMGKRIPSIDPLFMWVSYLAPHSDVSKRAKRGGYHVWSPAKYARHSTVGRPGSPAFNETYVNDKPGWIKTTPRLTKAEVADTVQARRERRDALRAVDDSVAKLVARLKALGELADTLILFTSDNGYMLGEHRLTLRKRFPYEESISVPLLARGPRIVPGHHPEPVANVDLAATIADVAGSPGPTTHPLEGLSLLGRVPASRPILVESPRGYGRMPAYAGVRTRDWIYVEYRTTRELYNMRVDPWQRLNRIAAPTLNATKRNLKALLASLRDCVGVECAP
jgi:N-acetylglucosamine-6-sulfatase